MPIASLSRRGTAFRKKQERFVITQIKFVGMNLIERRDFPGSNNFFKEMFCKRRIGLGREAT
jgi:hypothetical protein